MDANDRTGLAAAFGVGEIVDDKYRMVRVIGEGGWGVVFEGENVRTLKRVAVKILRPKATVGADALARFEREAQAAGRIGSEHIVEVFDVGVLSDDTHYLVMELLAGENLGQRLQKRGPADPIAAVRLLVQVLDGLAAAHRAGIVHRDLKPENIFLVPTRSGQDFVKILDFGISKFSIGPLSSATMTGAVLGSPYYMAPEQARGLKEIGPRADLYSAGAVLFECLTGRAPFEGDNFNDLMFQIVTATRPNPVDLRPGLDPALASIVVKAISADPAQRFPSAESFRARLAEWLEVQGAMSSEAPELHRWMRSTPPPTHLALDSSRGPLRPVEETPLASSSTPGAAGRSRRVTIIASLTALAVLSLVGGVLGRARLLGHVAPVASPPANAAGPAEPPTIAAAPVQGGTTAPGSPASKARIQDALVDITVQATPPNAKLFIDNVPLSGNPSVGQYPRDGQPHSVRVEASRYYTQTVVVRFDDQPHVVLVDLQRIPPPPPPPPPSASKN